MSEYKIKRELQLHTSRKNAFDLFVNQFSDWWPHEYTWSQDKLKKVTIEPKLNGRCYEEGPYDFICQFGRVLNIKENEQIKFTWQISPKGQPQPNPDNASEIIVNFIEKGSAETILVLEHLHIEKHGEGSAKYFDELNSEYGWDFILKRYLHALNKM